MDKSVNAATSCAMPLVFHRPDSYASAVALAAFAREELGRAGILFGLRQGQRVGRAG